MDEARDRGFGFGDWGKSGPLLLMFVCAQAGCAGDTVRSGMTESQVVARLGAPDVKSEHSGDLSRYSRWGDTPEYEWPLHDGFTLYWLDADRAADFGQYTFKRLRPIGEERTIVDRVLEPESRIPDPESPSL